MALTKPNLMQLCTCAASPVTLSEDQLQAAIEASVAIIKMQFWKEREVRFYICVELLYIPLMHPLRHLFKWLTFSGLLRVPSIMIRCNILYLATELNQHEERCKYKGMLLQLLWIWNKCLSIPLPLDSWCAYRSSFAGRNAMHCQQFKCRVHLHTAINLKAAQ